MLTKMMAARAQAILLSLVFAFLGMSTVTAQSRLEAARAKERALDRAAARVDPDSRDADRTYREAARATRERERLEQQERQEANDRRNNQAMADFRRADREQTERYLRERQEAQDRRNNQAMADFRRADREQTETYLREREQERRTNEMNRMGAALNADRIQTERYLRERQQAQRGAQRNSWEGLYDQMPPDRNVGNFIVSRDERLLYLQNGDRIALPTKWVWQGNAQIQVDRVFDMPLHYHVTITTRSEKGLEEQINEFVSAYGDMAAIANGLKTPHEVVTEFGIRLVWEVIKPQPLNEGETVYWRIPSAHHGVVDVQVINLK